MAEDPRFEYLRKGGEERWKHIHDLEDSEVERTNADAESDLADAVIVSDERIGKLEGREKQRTEDEEEFTRLAYEERMKRISTRIAYVIVGIACALVIGLLWHNIQSLQDVVERQDRIDRASAMETADRRNQICLSAEKEHLDEVTSLRRIYKFIGELSVDDIREPINKFIILNLANTEKEARSDDAPPFCDLPGQVAEKRGAKVVGLPEPDPEVPDRPADVDRKVKIARKQVRQDSR
jgi:hypothetical protein